MKAKGPSLKAPKYGVPVYKAPKAPKFKAPKIKGPKVPLIVPVIIPIGGGIGGYGRSRYGDRGVRCYSCEGRDNDLCVHNPAAVARRVTCRSGHYCNVVRIERGAPETNASSYNTSTTTVTSAETSTTTPATTPATTSATSTTIADTQSTTESIDTLSSTTESLLEILLGVLGEGDGTNETETTLVDTTLESSPMNVTKTLIESILKTESVEAEEPAPTNATSSSKNTTITVRPPTNYFLDARIIVSRGCRPVDFIESTLGTGSYSDLRKYTQFCTTDLCNYGDGRLQCYQCKGKGRELCVTRPSGVSDVVTCPASHYCSMVLIQTMDANETATLSVERGCRSLTGTYETGDDNENTKTLTRSCSSDLCNGADAEKLYLVSGSASICLESCVLMTLTLLFIYSINR